MDRMTGSGPATATPPDDNVESDNMTDQPTDVHVHYVEGEDPQTAALRDAVNGNRQILGIDPPPGRCPQRGIGDHDCVEHGDVWPAQPTVPLDPPGGPVASYRKAYLAKAREIGARARGIGAGINTTTEQLDECIAAGLAAADAVVGYPPAAVPAPVAVFGHHDHTEPTGAAMIYDRDGRLDLKWVDRAAHVTATPEVIEGFVEQVNRLRAEVAAWKVKCGRKDTEIEEEVFRRDRAEHQLTEVTEERDRLTAWSDDVAGRVPETYEGNDGDQETCIDAWIRDLEIVAGPFAATLRAVPVDRAIRLRAILATLPVAPDAVEHLYDAAARLGGE